MSIPKQYMKLVGQRQIMRGGLFSRKKAIEEQEFDILDIRESSATIMNMKTRKEFPAFELLVKNESMKRARWTNPFPIREKLIK